MELLDYNLTVVPSGNGEDSTAPVQDRTRFLRFTLTVHPRLINVDPQTFPAPHIGHGLHSRGDGACITNPGNYESNVGK